MVYACPGRIVHRYLGARPGDSVNRGSPLRPSAPRPLPCGWLRQSHRPQSLTHESPVNQHINLSVNQSIDQPVNRSLIPSANCPPGPAVSQSFSQSCRQAVRLVVWPPSSARPRSSSPGLPFPAQPRCLLKLQQDYTTHTAAATVASPPPPPSLFPFAPPAYSAFLAPCLDLRSGLLSPVSSHLAACISHLTIRISYFISCSPYPVPESRCSTLRARATALGLLPRRQVTIVATLAALAALGLSPMNIMTT